MYEPILISKTVWELLTPEQQAVLAEAGAAAEAFARESAYEVPAETVPEGAMLLVMALSVE